MYKQALLLSNNSIGLLDNENEITVLKNLHEKQITQVVVSHQHLVTGSYDKLVKVWRLTKTGVEQNPFYQMQLPKKIKRIVNVNDEYLVSDKHGDIYEISKDELQIGSSEVIKKIDPKSSNLAIPKYFGCFRQAGKDLLILADDYCKIKVINANNTDEILNVLIPLEGFLKQFIPYKDHYILLFKIVDEDNSTTCFKAFQIAQIDILNDQARFHQIFPTNAKEEEMSKTDKVRLYVSGGIIKYIHEKDGTTYVGDDLKLEKTKFMHLTNYLDQWVLVAKCEAANTMVKGSTLVKNKAIEIEDSLIQWVV